MMPTLVENKLFISQNMSNKPLCDKLRAHYKQTKGVHKGPAEGSPFCNAPPPRPANFFSTRPNRRRSRILPPMDLGRSQLEGIKCLVPKGRPWMRGRRGQSAKGRACASLEGLFRPRSSWTALQPPLGFVTKRLPNHWKLLVAARLTPLLEPSPSQGWARG